MNKRTNRMALLISLTLHLLVAGFIVFSPLSRTSQPVRITDLEIMTPEKFAEIQKKIDLANKKFPDSTIGQIVEQNERLNDERAADAKFLSKWDQKVLRETKAPMVDKFKNSTGMGGEKTAQQVLGENKKSKSTEQKPAKDTTEQEVKDTSVADQKSIPADQLKAAAIQENTKTFVESDNGVELKQPLKMQNSLMPSFKPRASAANMAQGGGEGPSATDDHLKDVQTGMQTLLSTREFVYYTYYNRIKEKLRQYWEPKIKEKFETAMRSGRTIASTGDKITKVVIILDKNGTLIRVQLLGQSGLTELDDAAVEAFRAAAPFPNPPKGIVDEDGTIKIRWDFILEAQSSFFSEKKYAGI